MLRGSELRVSSTGLCGVLWCSAPAWKPNRDEHEQEQQQVGAAATRPPPSAPSEESGVRAVCRQEEAPARARSDARAAAPRADERRGHLSTRGALQQRELDIAAPGCRATSEPRAALQAFAALPPSAHTDLCAAALRMCSCDYCDTYLTHDSVRHASQGGPCATGGGAAAPSDDLEPATLTAVCLDARRASCMQPSVRKQHNAGYKHKVRSCSWVQRARRLLGCSSRRRRAHAYCRPEAALPLCSPV